MSFLVGCYYQAKYQDVSAHEKYTHLIGTKYKTLHTLLVYGITTDRNYKKKIAYYTITEPPGIAGPEIISRGELVADTLIQVKKALKCINCIPSSIEFEVDILSEEKYRDHPVRIEEPEIKYKDGKVIFNSELFKKISE
jgi:hypothetical protein